MKVSSAVIDWHDWTLEVTDLEEEKLMVPLDRNIKVTMIGYPDREERTMLAGELEEYIEQGYILEMIEVEEESDDQG